MNDIWEKISEWLASLNWVVMGVTFALSLLFLLIIGIIYAALCAIFNMKVWEALLVVVIIAGVVTAAYNIAKRTE